MATAPVAQRRAGGGRAARGRTTLDPIGLEILRNRLEAIAEDSAMTIERTAISPIVTESKDYSATLLDADGNLVCGGGLVSFHWVAATRAIRATVERYGGAIAAGDVYLANDPYNGGGLHPGDVFVQRPIFVKRRPGDQPAVDEDGPSAMCSSNGRSSSTAGWSPGRRCLPT